MASESIRFDFLTSGAEQMARNFKNVGDTAGAAARGAEVLKRTIESLGSRENRTAEESARLARALRLTGDEEDRAAAKALAADVAIRRLADAEAKAADKGQGLGKTLSGLKPNPGLAAPLLALVPALATLSGVAAGAAAGLGGAFVAGGAALAAFGAVAKPVLSDAQKAAQAVSTAQDNYNIAIAHGTKQAVAYKAEQVAIAKAYAELSPAQIRLSKQIGAMSKAWQDVKAAQTPVVAGALQPWLKSVTDLTRNLGPIVASVAPVIKYLGGQFDALINSAAFKGFRDFIAGTGTAAVSATGTTLIDLVKSFIILLPKFDPLIREAVGWIGRLGPAILAWSSSKRAADDIQGFIRWVSQNGPVVTGLLKNLGGALKAFAPGLTTGGALELKVTSDFLGFVAKLPPALAKPLAEVAGALLILNKLGVVSVGVKLIGLGKGGAASGAASAAEGAAAGGLWARILPGVRLLSGALVAVVAIDAILKNTPSGKGKNWFDNPFGFPGPKDKGSANNWLTSWSPYINKFKANIHGMAVFFTDAWNTAWSNVISGAVKDWGRLTALFDNVRHVIARIWDVLMNDVAKAFDITVNQIGIGWDHIELAAFGTVKYILNIFARLPGPLGAPFRAAARDIGNSMAGVQADIRRRTAQIQADINSIHGKTVSVHLQGSAGGGVTFTETAQNAQGFPIVKGSLQFHAAGGLVTGGVPGRDSVLGALMPGEVVVPTPLVKAGAVDHLRGRLPGFAGGGLVGNLGAGPQFVAGAEAAFGKAAESQFVQAAIAAAKRAAANPFAGITGVPSGPPISGSAAAAQAFAKSILWAYGWTQAQFPPLQALWNQESGWRWNALNPSSGAYGIPQALPASKMASAGADWRTNPATQIRWGLGYIKARYGSPAAAEGHELAYHWYDKGGWLKPGLTLAYNGTGRPEQVIPAGGRDTPKVVLEVLGAAGPGTFDAFLLKWIQEHVRIRGGGSVQHAFGRRLPVMKENPS